MQEAAANLAVLIDGDNASSKVITALLAEIAHYGTTSVKRIYGDWTQPNLNAWKAVLLEHSLQPIQQFGYTAGKNATDGAMIIDAMDLLYTNRFSGFCLVSSDSDFTRLASRLREQGVMVYGFGERKTPRPFITACDKFTYFDVLMPPAAETAVTPQAPVKLSSKKQTIDKALNTALVQAVATLSPDAEWTHLGAVGSYIAKQMPDFDPRNYGFTKMSELIEASALFDIKRDTERQGAIYVRLRRTA